MQGGVVLTAVKLKNLLAAMPDRVLRKIARLSKESGESVESIVEHGVALYEQRRKRLSSTADSGGKLADLIRDPRKRAVYLEIMGALGRRAGETMTKAQRIARAVAGAKGRAEKLTPAQRKAIAKAAVEARWSRARGEQSGEE